MHSKLNKKYLFNWLSITVLTLLAGCINSECSTSKISEISSPDLKYVATISEKDCGATTTTSNIVSIRKSNLSFDDNKDENFVFVSTGKENLKLKWVEKGTLEISHTSGKKKIFLQRNTYDSIKIEYR